MPVLCSALFRFASLCRFPPLATAAFPDPLRASLRAPASASWHLLNASSQEYLCSSRYKRLNFSPVTAKGSRCPPIENESLLRLSAPSIEFLSQFPATLLRSCTVFAPGHGDNYSNTRLWTISSARSKRPSDQSTLLMGNEFPGNSFEANEIRRGA